jgi:hypothetical protein
MSYKSALYSTKSMPCKTLFNTGKFAGQNIYQPIVRDVNGNLLPNRGDFKLPDIEEAEIVKRECAETVSRRQKRKS